ncbi:uncharacterized protein LOC124139996 [Haliotis rufescens]|uniref:uncharacterized protein LOC124139996 n=1 Tax=Haliotis rufescens TaxID=6454 RepID=UPI00201EA039|nr:uncharacterized protein LOC124139996 [Haliotis rufescens]
MSVTTLNHWSAVCVALCLPVLGVVPMEISTQTSKGCYGTFGLPCTKHDISCNSTQKIAIYDAYYTGNTECGAGLSSCTVNPDNVTEHGSNMNRFNNTELVSLYNKCSTETQCVYPAPRRSAALTFSIVKYQCFERDSIVNISTASGQNASDITVVYKQSGSTHLAKMKDYKYTCMIQSLMPVNITALDIRLGPVDESQNCSRLTIVARTYDCVEIQHYRQLQIKHACDGVQLQKKQACVFITLDVQQGTHTIVWLRIKSISTFFISCNMKGLTRRPHPNSNPDTTSVISGAVVGILLCVAAVVIFIWFWRNRNDKKPIRRTPRKTTPDGQANTSYPPADSAQQGNYDEIDDLRQHLASNYDYVTANDVINSNAYFILESGEHPFRSNEGSNKEDDYNHMRDGLSRSPPAGNYDTTASAEKSLQVAGDIQDENAYDHLKQATPTEKVSNDYDVTEKHVKLN